jgi:hypothetical protein
MVTPGSPRSIRRTEDQATPDAFDTCWIVIPWLIRACRASSPMRVFCSRARRLLDAVLVMALIMAMTDYHALTAQLFETDAPECMPSVAHDRARHLSRPMRRKARAGAILAFYRLPRRLSRARWRTSRSR